jgi:glycerol 3-phosphatase-2
VEGDRLVVEGEGSPADWWRVVAVAAWGHLDDNGEPVATDDVEPPR